MRKRIICLLHTVFLIILILFAGCDDGSDRDYKDTIVCLGDSLTAGYGSLNNPPLHMDPSKAYPARLEKRVSRDVINSGVSGSTTEFALARLDSAVLDYDPVVVVVELGANDLFQGIDIAVTESNLQDIIAYIDDGRRKLYLAKFYTETVGRSFLDDYGITDPEDQATILAGYDAMFSSLEAENDIELIEDIWTGVWGVAEHMFSDGIHPDASGYAVMAENYFAVMEPYLESRGWVEQESGKLP